MFNIVLVEDNPQVARLIEKILRPYDCHITHAADAENGIWWVESIQPDLVLLDIELPDMKGEVVALRLSQQDHTQHIPIIAVTANPSVAIQHMAISSGCREVITKPIDTREFPHQVAKHLPLAS